MDSSEVDKNSVGLPSNEMSLAMLPEKLRLELATLAVPLSLSSGETLFRKGEVGNEMYIIESGEVRIHLSASGEVKTLGPGQFLGEIALLAPGVNRTGTAIAAGDCELQVLKLETVKVLEKERPQLLCALLQETCAYLVASEHRLFADLRRRNRELEHTLDYLERTQEELVASDLLAHTDELTGIYNRRCLNSQLPKYIERAERTSTPLAVLLLDLDRLKLINDTRGHHVGDIALQSVALLLKDMTRKSDLPCRIAGDEFAIVIGNTVDEVAYQRAEAIVRAVSEMRPNVEGAPLRLTLSAGGTMFTAGDSPDSLLKRADLSLYVAKDNGRNTIVWKGRIRGE